MHACIQIHIYICVYVCMYMYKHKCLHRQITIYVYIYICVCVYTYVCRKAFAVVSNSLCMPGKSQAAARLWCFTQWLQAANDETLEAIQRFFQAIQRVRSHQHGSWGYTQAPDPGASETLPFQGIPAYPQPYHMLIRTPVRFMKYPSNCPDPWADPTSRSTLGFRNLPCRPIGIGSLRGSGN